MCLLSPVLWMKDIIICQMTSFHFTRPISSRQAGFCAMFLFYAQTHAPQAGGKVGTAKYYRTDFSKVKHFSEAEQKYIWHCVPLLSYNLLNWRETSAFNSWHCTCTYTIIWSIPSINMGGQLKKKVNNWLAKLCFKHWTRCFGVKAAMRTWRSQNAFVQAELPNSMN